MLEAYLRRKQARVKIMFVLLTNSFFIVQYRRLCPTTHKMLTAPDIPSAFLAISDSGDFWSSEPSSCYLASSIRSPYLPMYGACCHLIRLLRNCLASRQPVLFSTLRHMSSLSDHQIIFQICKGLGYGRSDEARICPLCPHETPHSSHAEFACSIRIEAVRTMSRFFRCTL